MFIIKPEQLLRLKGGVNENIGNWLAGRRFKNEDLAPGVSFKDLEKKYEEAEDMAKGVFETTSHAFSDSTLRKLCPPIEFVGVGSSRQAYACFGGKCLKLAMTPAGRAQNRAEMNVAGPHVLKKDYSCFSQVYAIGADGWLLLTECCTHVYDREKLAHDLGLVSWRSIMAMMRAIQRIGLDFSAWDAASLLAKYSEPGEDENA